MKSLFSTALVMLILVSCEDTKQDTAGTDVVPAKDTLSTSIESNEGETAPTINSSKDLHSFVPNEFSILNKTRGDLNKDSLKDVILVLNYEDETKYCDVNDSVINRPLLILTQNEDGTYTKRARNDNTVYCYCCGGIMGDPFTGITIKDGYFSVEHYGGSNWRWERIVTYKYDPSTDDWLLHKDGRTSFHSSVDYSEKEVDIKTKEDFGIVKFVDFNINEE